MTNREVKQAEASLRVDELVEKAVAKASVEMVEYKALMDKKKVKLDAFFARVLTTVTQTVIILLIAGIGLLTVYGIWWVLQQLVKLVRG